jgi:hypothetical protein
VIGASCAIGLVALPLCLTPTPNRGSSYVSSTAATPPAAAALRFTPPPLMLLPPRPFAALPPIMPAAAVAVARPGWCLGLCVTAMSSKARVPDRRTSHTRTSPAASPDSSWCSFDGDQQTAHVPVLQAKHKPHQHTVVTRNVCKHMQMSGASCQHTACMPVPQRTCITVGRASLACMRSLACVSSLACRGRVSLNVFLLKCC